MLKILVNTGIGIVLIAIWLKFVDVSQIVLTLSRVDALNLVPVFLFMLLSPIIRAIRLKVFLKEIKKIPLLNLIFLNGVAMMLNFYIPIRAGEIAKGVYLATYTEQEKIRKRSEANIHLNVPPKAGLAKWITWVFMDRFIDFLVVLVLAVSLLLIIPTSLNITFIIVIIIILTTALVLTCLAIFQANFVRKIVNFLRYLLIFNNIRIYFDRVSNFILDSFSILKRHPKDLFFLSIITVLAYAADAAIWYFTFIALGASHDFLKMYLGQLLSALTYLIPAAPGYVGSAEASGLLILSGVFGIEANLSSAMIVLFHILSALFVLIFGLISVFSLKIDLGLILKKVLRKGD